MNATFTSKLPEFTAALETALAGGMTDAAERLAEIVRAKLAHGYTSGAFVTGEAAASVRVQVDEENGAFAVAVGSDLLYVAAWELGHHNLFTDRFERVQYWKQAAEELAAQAQGILNRHLAPVKSV